MKYATEAAFRAALEARFMNLAGPRNDKQLVRFRKMVVYERLLARLAVVAPERWMVKGGLALEFRYGTRARTTLDLDLGTMTDLTTAAEALFEAGSLDLGDYFRYEFDPSRSLQLPDEVNVDRYRITAILDRRRFEQLTIDVGTGHLPPVVDSITTANLLEFAGFEPVVIPAIPLEIHVAEKLHAYTKQYDDGRQNTRVKDLIDLVLIASLSRFEMGALRTALDSTFGSRQVQALPITLPRPGEHWRFPYAQLAREVGLPDDLDEGYRAAAAFLDPALSADRAANARWEPVQFEWSV